MHPLNKKNFGTSGIEVSFYNGSSVVSGYITKQVGTNTFQVTDGTTTATVSLAPTTAIAEALSSNPTYCTILTYPPGGTASGATFTPTYEVNAATVVSSPSNFNVGDSLALPSGSGALTVATLSGSAIATVTVGTAGTYTTLSSNPTTCTRAAGTGATFTAHYGISAATIVGAGTSYTAADVLTLTGTGGGQITVNTVSGGVIQTFTVSNVGTVTSLPSNPVAVTGGTGTGATFTLTWKLLSVGSSGGTGYNVGDTLIFNGMTATATPAAHISVATSHAATTVVVDAAGSGISVAATSITSSPTTATFTVTYDLASVATSGGTGYAVDDQLEFNGLVATGGDYPAAYVSSVSSGVPTAVTVSNAGTGISTAASTITVGGPSQYVERIWEKRLFTTAGNEYFWSLGTSINGAAVVPAY